MELTYTHVSIFSWHYEFVIKDTIKTLLISKNIIEKHYLFILLSNTSYFVT